jgi:hypothetical protein
LSIDLILRPPPRQPWPRRGKLHHQLGVDRPGIAVPLRIKLVHQPECLTDCSHPHVFGQSRQVEVIACGISLQPQECLDASTSGKVARIASRPTTPMTAVSRDCVRRMLVLGGRRPCWLGPAMSEGSARSIGAFLSIRFWRIMIDRRLAYRSCNGTGNSPIGPIFPGSAIA